MKRLSIVAVAVLMALCFAVGSAGAYRNAIVGTTFPCSLWSAGILTAQYQPSQQAQEYSIGFTAQGIGRMETQSIPINYWVLTGINSPSAPHAYTDILTVDDPYWQFRMTGLIMSIQPAHCDVYTGDMTITNASIVPITNR